MSLMHDALKEMDKPRPDSAGAGAGTGAGTGAATGNAAAAAPAATAAPSVRHDNTASPKGMTALDWQVAKFNADARAAADADAYENVSTGKQSESDTSGLNITLIAWILGSVLCVILAALWWVQSRQSQQAVNATEGIAALNPVPKNIAPVTLAALPETIPAALPVSVSVPVAAATPTVLNDVLLTAPTAAAVAIPSLLASSTVVSAVAVPAVAGPLAVAPIVAPPASTLVKQPSGIPVASVSTSATANARAQEPSVRTGVLVKDAPRPRTAILSTTTLPPPPVIETLSAINAISTAAAMPDATAESKLASAALAPAPASAEAPKPPQLSAKQQAAQAAATAAETKRKEAATQQIAAARVATSKNAASRFAAIGRALESGNRTMAQNELNSLEQELPASSLTLLRARAWVVGTGADLAAARGAYAAILARLPDDENALLNMAALEAKDGKMDAARAFLAQALSANPESAAAKAAQQRIATLTAQPR